MQRDILPIVEGTTVNTRYGMVRTDHILFIAAGAFHVSKPSDLIPELQGRFPIRVELESLTVEDFKRILTEPKNALIKQYQAMMETEGVTIEFTDDAIDSIANFAARVNEQTENIGARRLQTIMEKLLEEISFEGPDLEPKNQRSTRPMSTACSPKLSRIRTSAGTFCERNFDRQPLGSCIRHSSIARRRCAIGASRSPSSCVGCGKRRPPLPPVERVQQRTELLSGVQQRQSGDS